MRSAASPATCSPPPWWTPCRTFGRACWQMRGGAAAGVRRPAFERGTQRRRAACASGFAGRAGRGMISAMIATRHGGSYPAIMARIGFRTAARWRPDEPGTAAHARHPHHLARGRGRNPPACRWTRCISTKSADWDSLIDVVAAGSIAAALEGARWTVSALPRGGAWFGRSTACCRCRPRPPPALLEGFAWRDDGIGGERVTPTGAAILRHLVGPQRQPARLAGRLDATGTGAGTSELAGSCRTSCARCVFADARAEPTPTKRHHGALLRDRRHDRRGNRPSLPTGCAHARGAGPRARPGHWQEGPARCTRSACWSQPGSANRCSGLLYGDLDASACAGGGAARGAAPASLRAQVRCG